MYPDDGVVYQQLFLIATKLDLRAVQLRFQLMQHPLTAENVISIDAANIHASAHPINSEYE